VNAVEHRGTDAPSHSDLGPGEQGVVISRGTRVYLRTMTVQDLEHLSRWVDDPFLDRMVGSELLHSYRDVWERSPAFYEAVLTDPAQVVLMVEACHGWTQPIGVVRLFNIHLLEGYAFLEAIIADVRAMKRGFGVEAGKLLCCYGMDVLGLRRIEAKVYAYNALSMNCLRRNGFRQEGVLRQAGFDGKHYCDVVVFGILKEEMETQRQKEKVQLPLDPVEGNGREPT
jgi:[ribosomal protein S5]-alanine N-acetyltransferase